MADYYEHKPTVEALNVLSCYVPEADVPVDGRSAQFNEWLDLDNKVKALEEERRVIGKKLDELKPRLHKLGRQISETVYPSEKAMTEPGNDFVKGVTDW